MPRKVLIVTTILCLLAGGLGLWLGYERVSLTESDVIAAAAARWSSDTGQSDLSTCVAYAGTDANVWLEVTCGMEETKRQYAFDRRGNLITRSGMGL
ncbi:MAG: hypothetical protein AAGK71_09235 [Pseudomonadota bacterium]